MADVNANIGVKIDTSDALAQLKNLQRQISQFHNSVAKSSESAGQAQRNLQKNFLNSVNAIEGFSAELRSVKTTAESFSNSLEKNKFSMREYFRFAASQTKTFGKNFSAEFSTIEKTAIERVKTLQTQYIKLGRDANGAMQSIAIRPTMLNMKDLGTQTAIAAQKQVIFNQLIKQGSTNLLNFGKNTQWAGRQLMVGFTLPLATLGLTAGRVFMDMEKAAIKFKKVYGDLFTAPGETEEAMKSIVELGKAYTAYGVAVSESLDIAADAAAAGFAGVDLQNQTSAALKLSVLGQLSLQKALETTISLQNAFGISSANLSGEIDFLNAVENQTVVALSDITEAIPRVAPVIKALGGDVRDLAFFMAAMKEGGVNAAQGANALKSGLASLINPTDRARAVLSGFGVNLRGIIEANKGDVSGVVVDFAKALDTLDPMNRAQAIEQLFGKFQFARMSTLFANVAKDGTQASRVLDLAGSSLEDLAALSEGELGVAAASSMNKFLAAVEGIKLALAPIGKIFLDIATPIVEFGTRMLEAFNNLPDGIKKSITTVITVIGGIGPIALMTFGLINNGIANMIKFFATIRLGYLKITGQAQGVGDETSYMTQEQLEASAAAASLDQAHAGLTQRFTAEKVAVDALRDSYEAAVAAGNRFALLNPGMMRPGFQNPTQMAKGGVVTVGGRGNKDTEPALLTPGEAVIPAAMVKKYQPLIEGMIAGNIPGYAKGVMLGMPKSSKGVSKHRNAAEEIYQMFLKSNYANTLPTEYGHQIAPTAGHSFPIFGLGGVYQKGNKQVFVKPVLDEKAALAEMRSTEISRMAHGLEAPEQRIVVIKDPLDLSGKRRFLALESDLDPKFVNDKPMGLFNEDQYFRQLVASLLRVDKDLSGSNVFGNVVADAGPAGVFSRASGLRDYEQNLPSMEEQAMINLLGIRGGAKRAFAESTLGMMAGLTPEQYRQRMLGEIQQVLPKLKQTIASFQLTDPTEVGVYDDMIRRLEQGLGVDWGKFHSIHSAVKIPKPKVAKLPGYKDGVVAVPGQKGKGDVVPAMLSPGEAVIPTEMAKKYAPLIDAMISGNIPGYNGGKEAGGTANFGAGDIRIANAASARALQEYYDELIGLNKETSAVKKMFADLVASGKIVNRNQIDFVDISRTQAKELAKANSAIKTSKVSDLQLGHLQTPTEVLDSGQRRSGSLVRAMTRSQNRGLASKATLEDGTEVRGQLVDNFARDWNSVTGGLADTVKLGGAELTDGIISATQRIDDEIRDLAIASAENGRVSDEILEKATNEALRRAAERGGDDAIAAAALEATKEMEVILPATVDTLKDSKALRDAGIKFGDVSFEKMVQELETKGFLKRVKTSGGRDDYVTTEKGKDLTFTGQEGERFARTRSSGKIQPADRVATGDQSYQDIHGKITASLVPTPQELAATEAAGVEGGKQIKKAAAKGVRDGLGINSPADEITDIADEVAAGARESKPEAKKAGEELGETISTSAAKTPRRVTTDGNVVVNPRNNQLIEQGRLDRLNANRQQAMARVGGMAAKNIATMAQNSMNAGFAITSLAGIATMFGGTIGKVAGIVMQVTGLFTGLAAATSRYMVTLNAANMMTVFANAGVGKFGKGLMGGAKGLKGLKNAMATTSAALSKGFPKTAAAVSKALSGIVRAIGPLGQKIFARLGFAAMSAAAAAGALAAAIAAIVAIIIGGVVAYKMARDNVQRLGDVANMSSDKIDKFAQLFGITARKSDFEGKFAGTTAKTSEDQNKVEMVLQMENFEKDYKDQIKGIKDATVEEAQTALQSLTTQLSASGFEEDAVEAIINAIAVKAGRKDLDLSFSSIDFSSPEGLAAIDTVAKDTITRLETAFAGKNIWDSIGVGEFTKQLDFASANFTTAFQSLQIGFREGELSAEDFISSMTSLNTSITSLDPRIAKDLVNTLAKDLNIEKKVEGLDNFQDKLLLVNAATAGIEIPEKVVRALAKASKAGASKKDLQTAVKLRTELKELIEEETKALEEAKDAEEAKALMTAAVQDAKVSIEEQITALQNEATAYQILMEAGWDAASAIEAVSDATIASAFAMAATADERQGLINDLSQLMNMRREADARKEASSGGGGGGGSKSPMQEALESLGKQRTEIKNNIAAYASLRKAGFSAAEAAEAAGDATLAAALASTKVGSSEWKALVNQIRLVRVEALKTSDGIRNAFAGLKNQANEYYDILERQVERKFADGLRAAEKQAKSLSRAIEDLRDITDEYQEQVDDLQREIEIQFNRPIEALNEETSDLANDLSLMDRVADKITKRYDEQVEALERVNKINQRIIAQQKQQVGLASALVEGDISAAAAAVQDIRASNAEAASQTQVEMLNVAKQAELDALRSASGMSRLEIEERQFEISQLIYGLEEQREEKLDAIRIIEDKIYAIQEDQIEPLEAQLKANEKIVQAIEDQKDEQLEAIDAQRRKWEDAQLALDLAEVKAGKFNEVIDMAKKLTGDVVADWESLEDQTRILTIETVLKGIGGEPYDAAIVQESGGSGGGGGRNTPAGEPVELKDDITAPETKKPDPFGWLEDSLAEVGSWWDNFVNQPWVKSLAAMAIGTYNIFIKPIVDWITERWNEFAAWFDTTVIQPIKSGWDSLTRTIDENVIQPAKKMWEDLNTFVDTKITEIGEWWNGLPLVQGFKDFFAWFNKDDTIENKIQDVENWWKGVGENIGSAWEDGIAWFKDLPNKISRQAGNIWGKIQGAGAWLATQGNNFNTWITRDVPAAIAQGGEDLWNGIEGIGDWLGEQATSFQNWLGNLPSNIIQWAGFIWAAMRDIGPWLEEQFTSLQVWFTEDLPAGIEAWGASVWEGMQDVGAWLATQWENFMTWMTVTLPEGIAAWGASVWQGMQDVGAWLATQWENFRTWATVTLPNGIRQWGANTWASIQNIGQWLATQFEAFRTWLTVTVPNAIRQWGANTWASIQNIGQWLATQFEAFRTWLTVTLPNGIVNWARNLWTNGLPTLGNWLAARATELQNWFRDLPGRIAGWAGNIFSGLGNLFAREMQIGEQKYQNMTGKGSATGGMIYRNAGGDVPGIGNTDTVPAMLTPGEFVMNKRSTSKYRPALKAMNAGAFSGGMAANRYKVQAPTYSPSNLSGGVYNVPSKGQASNSNIAMFAPQTTTATQLDNPVYNYSLSVNVNGSNASADDIASTVMNKIKRVDSQRLRKQVVR